VQGLTVFPLWLRLQNVLLSYIVYIFKFLWPAGLAVFYPYPASIAVWKATFAALAILAISALVLLSIRTRPYLAIGWFWYLGTLVPVIGLMQAGAQARADRYMYVPMVGLLIILVWGAEEFVKRRSISPRLQVAAVSAVCAALAVACVIQIRYWRNTETLFRHALDVTRRNYLAEHNLGSYLLRFPERQAEAAAHLEASLTLDPNNAGTHSDLGIALSNMPNRLPDAIAQYRIALHLNPNSAILHNNLGTALEKTGRMTEAIAQYEVALRIDPNYADVRKNLASALTQSRLRAARFQ